jgi:antitoxin (DNA-binding transcriptional repressor) of toxin-antitoxin stability system
MRTVTMLHFRKNTEAVVRRVSKGERLILSYRGKAAMRLEPVQQKATPHDTSDPFLEVAARATRSPNGRTRHADTDGIVYGGN